MVTVRSQIGDLDLGLVLESLGIAIGVVDFHHKHAGNVSVGRFFAVPFACPFPPRFLTAGDVSRPYPSRFRPLAVPGRETAAPGRFCASEIFTVLFSFLVLRFVTQISKEQFHCNDCGICRVGGSTNFFHCEKCGSCFDVKLRGNHTCIGNSMKNHCPICYEFLFDTIKASTIMACGHGIHLDCSTELIRQDQYRCPICSKSMSNMSRTWQRLDQEIEATVMPEEYRYEIHILCNDCHNTSKAFFHIFGHKCGHCKSYNTRRIGTTDDSLERRT